MSTTYRVFAYTAQGTLDRTLTLDAEALRRNVTQRRQLVPDTDETYIIIAVNTVVAERVSLWDIDLETITEPEDDMMADDQWQAWMDMAKASTADPHLAALQSDADPECPACHGLGWEMDMDGDAVPCDDCGYEDPDEDDEPDRRPGYVVASLRDGVLTPIMVVTRINLADDDREELP
ncbi:MAG: hypothetical protein WBA46_06390 [Thermomicrobiales bacterium]